MKVDINLAELIKLKPQEAASIILEKLYNIESNLEEAAWVASDIDAWCSDARMELVELSEAITELYPDAGTEK